MSDFYCRAGHPITAPSFTFGRAWCPTCEIYGHVYTETEVKVLDEASKLRHPSNTNGRTLRSVTHDVQCPRCALLFDLRVDTVETSLPPFPETPPEVKAALIESAQSTVPIQ